MQRWKDLRLRRTACGVLLIGLAALSVGCETDSPTSPVVIDPGHVQMRRGQQQEFVASGGYEYEWSLENKEIGTLTRTPDDRRVVYTVLTVPEEGTEVQVLKVASWIDGASRQRTDTNDDSDSEPGDSSRRRVRAEAYIVHLADPDPADPVEELTIVPSEVTLEDEGDSQLFTVSGGTPNYQWSLSNTNLGTLAVHGDQAGYTRGPDSGLLFIIAKDAAGREVSAAITQTD